MLDLSSGWVRVMERDVGVTYVFIRFLGIFFILLVIDDWGSVEGLIKNSSEEARAVAPAAKAVEENFYLD